MPEPRAGGSLERKIREPHPRLLAHFERRESEIHIQDRRSALVW